MSSTPTHLRPRKRPQQTRAHETRRRILDAAARVFAEHGYASGTTNRIAAAAGLSVGSLYQYFPNKDAILVELVRDHVADGTARIAACLAEPGFGARPLAERLGLLVDAVIAAHVGAGRLHQVLFEEAPRPPSLLEELHALEAEVVAIAEEMLRSDPAVTVGDPTMAARLVVAGIESMVHRHVASAQPPVDVDGFRSELLSMLTRYLTG